jgi:hypothetical protein
MSGVIGWLILLVNVVLAVDAGRRPYSEWDVVGRDKNFWVVMLLFFGVLFLIPYLLAVRPRLQIAKIGTRPNPSKTAPAVIPKQPPKAEKGGFVTTAAVVQNRSGTRRIDALKMLCNDREIPRSNIVGESPGYWLAGVGIFEGTAALLADDGTFTPGYEIGVTGTVMLAAGDGKCIAIVSPNEATAPAVWLSVNLADLQVTTKGQIGVFKKRPQQLVVQCDGWELVMGRIDRYNQKTGKAFGGYETSLLAALGASG